MKKALLLLPVTILLISCSSKKEICAEFFSNPNPYNTNSVEHVADYWKKLGLKSKVPSDYGDARRGIEGFCEFYK